MMRRQGCLVAAGLLMIAALAGCKEYGVAAGTSPHRELNFLDMGDQPKVKAQRGDLLGGPDFMPPSGAIPRGFDPYLYANAPETAAVKLTNTLDGNDPQVQARGKQMYERLCVPCHGSMAAGDGAVVQKGFPAPPSLMTKRVRDWSDGRIYHVMAAGQNIMPSYASQTRPHDRWAIVHYIRKLQGQLPVAAEATVAAPVETGAGPMPSVGDTAMPANSAGKGLGEVR